MPTISLNIAQGKMALRKAASSDNHRIHIIPSYDNWIVKKEGLKTSSGKFSSKSEAIEFAKDINKSDGTIVIHKKDGSIEEAAK